MLCQAVRHVRPQSPERYVGEKNRPMKRVKLGSSAWERNREALAHVYSAGERQKEWRAAS